MTGQKGEPQDWRDWQPADAPAPPLMTRAEVLALLERWGTEPPVDERTLRYWEARGLVPRPIRTVHAGAYRTRYPSWVVDLCATIRFWQRDGSKLAHIARLVRAEAARLARNPRPHPFPLDDVPPDSFGAYLRQYWREFIESWQDAVDGPRFPSLPAHDPPTLPPRAEAGVADALRAVLWGQHARRGFTAARIEVRLIDAAGQARVYHIPLPDWLPPDMRGDAPAADDTGGD
ncbi:MAG: MerR family transcriptional regulator [Chloroflexota bacterium]|nr:MerR family transcriptional regulator [Chloroflexota bacterium]